MPSKQSSLLTHNCLIKHKKHIKSPNHALSVCHNGLDTVTESETQPNFNGRQNKFPLSLVCHIIILYSDTEYVICLHKGQTMRARTIQIYFQGISIKNKSNEGKAPRLTYDPI